MKKIMHDLSYQKRLTVLNLETLEYRRLSNCVVLIYLQMIFLTVQSLHGIAGLVLSLIQSMLLRFRPVSLCLI